MRFRTATILSIVLVGGMFCLPEIIVAVFHPSAAHGSSAQAPPFERVLIDIAVFCSRFKWVFAFPIVMVLFTIAIFMKTGAGRNRFRHSSE